LNLRSATFAAILLVAGPAMAETPSPPLLTATGDGSVMVVPDIAIVTIGVVSRGATAREALDANSADIGKVIDAIRGEGVADKDIGTSGFSVNPVYEAPPDNGAATRPPRVLGYDISNEVRVTIRDIAASGAVLDKVVSAGANQVNGISFEVADRVKPAEEALKRAVADARRKAAIMAAAAGVKLVRVLSVSADTGGGYYPTAAPMVKSMAVPVMPGQQAINQSATVVWEVAPE
jgi:uncharacterized protein YggE